MHRENHLIINTDNDVVFTFSAMLTKRKEIFSLVYIPSTRAANMGALFTLPVFTGRVEKKMFFLNTVREHGSCKPAFNQ